MTAPAAKGMSVSASVALRNQPEKRVRKAARPRGRAGRITGDKPMGELRLFGPGVARHLAAQASPCRNHGSGPCPPAAGRSSLPGTWDSIDAGSKQSYPGLLTAAFCEDSEPYHDETEITLLPPRSCHLCSGVRIRRPSGGGGRSYFYPRDEDKRL